jgi:hypothetical protein
VRSKTSEVSELHVFEEHEFAGSTCIHATHIKGDRFQHVTVVSWCAKFMPDRTSCEITNRTSLSPTFIPKK